MRIVETNLPEIRLVYPVRHGDSRGFLSETFVRSSLVAAGIDAELVQENHTCSRAAGTVRGLHFQVPPRQQGKLVRVLRGAILDVAVDIRRNSPTFGQHVAVRLDADEWGQIWIPPGFAHGFCTLLENTEVLYKITDYHSPAHERGIAWDDPALGIEWPVEPTSATLSDRDRTWPPLSEVEL